MNLEIKPVPTESERRAIVEALLAPEAGPAAYRSRWRAAGLTELVPHPAIDSAFLAEHEPAMRRPQSARYKPISSLPASLPDDLVLSPETRDHYRTGH